MAEEDEFSDTEQEQLARTALQEQLAEDAAGVAADSDLEDARARLSKDLKAASVQLGRRDARWLVDMYYTVQNNRVRAAHQRDASAQQHEPHALVGWSFQAMRSFERSVKVALGQFAAAYNVGRWLQGIFGIGPVISAGLLSHLDIRRARTVSQFWRYAGLDPDCRWPSADDAAKAIRQALAEYKSRQFDPPGCVELYYRYAGQAATVQCPHCVASAAELIERHGAAAVQAVVPTWARWHKNRGLRGEFCKLAAHFEEAAAFFRELCALRRLEAPEHAGPVPLPVVRAVAEQYGRNVFNLLAVAQGKQTVDALSKALARRPWNARLKTLVVFKMGETFWKFHNKDECFYGQYFAEEKARLAAANDAGKFAECAGRQLAERGDKLRSTAGRLGHWRAGRLAPAQIHGRARRKTVKLLLAHLHEVMHRDFHGSEPPAPYAFEHPETGNHRHKIPLAGWPLEGELAQGGRSLAQMQD